MTDDAYLAVVYPVTLEPSNVSGLSTFVSLFCVHRQQYDDYKELEFIPFNPTDKRTEATVKHPDGRVFRVRCFVVCTRVRYQ